MGPVHSWSIINVQFLRVVPLIVASATIMFAERAEAAGTAAGTTISNTATATYNDPGGNPQSVNSNPVNILVDELLDVTVASADPGDVVVGPGTTNRVLKFTVTNTGNGPEAFTLTSNSAIGGDQFDPTTTSIVLDTNGNGTYDAGVDTVYTAGTNDPLLNADQSVTVFVLSTIPVTGDGNRGFSRLTAAANTGTGAPGTAFAGQGQGGGAAVVGSTGADGADQGAYLVQNATVTFVKSVQIADPFGGSQPVPGAIATYTLVATVTGSGTITNTLVADPIPANTSYRPGTITLNGAGQTDGADADAGRFTGSAVNVLLGSVTGPATHTITFQVTLN